VQKHGVFSFLSFYYLFSYLFIYLIISLYVFIYPKANILLDVRPPPPLACPRHSLLAQPPTNSVVASAVEGSLEFPSVTPVKYHQKRTSENWEKQKKREVNDVRKSQHQTGTLVRARIVGLFRNFRRRPVRQRPTDICRTWRNIYKGRNIPAAFIQ